MKLSYRVTREQYTDLIAMSMRERAMKPAQLVLTAVMCGLPVVLVLALLVTGGLRGMQMLLLSAAALALAAANLALRTRYHGRARRELERMLESGRVDKRFFDQQTLGLNDRGIVLSYPGISTRYDWTDYTGLIERRDAILLYFGGEPAAIVPLSAFDGEDERKAFLSAMDASVRAVLIADTREKREDIPAHPFSILHYSYDLATYLRHQREARRAALLQVSLWRRMDSIKVIAIIFLLASVFLSERRAVSVMGALMLLVLALPYVLMFTPLADLPVRRSLEQVLRYRPGRDVTLYAWEEGIKIVGDIHCLDIPWTQIRAAAELDGALALYLTSGLPLTVPVSETIQDSVRFKLFMLQRFRKRARRS